MNLFTHCVLTATDQRQADAFSSLLSRRIRGGLYPREIAFHVYPDPPGRVGSGAGTLWALHRLYDEIGYDPAGGSTGAPSVLVLHAAGESRRLPVFAPEGKLFAPVPVASSSVLPPVVLDLQLALYLRFPWTSGQVVVGSGDVIIDFDTESISDTDASIAGFAAPASFEQGSRHGVLRFDHGLRSVEEYFQKQPADFLAAEAVIEGTDRCALDIGIVSMGPAYVARLFDLARARSSSGVPILDAISTGSLRFGLYLEQLTASLASVDRGEYLRRIAGGSALPVADQELFFERFHDLPLGGHLARQCTFLHFGSLAEYPQAAGRIAASGIRPFYALLDGDEIAPERAGNALVANSHDTRVDAPAADAVFADACEAASFTARGAALISGLCLPFAAPVPHGFCVDVRSTADGLVTALYHASDSFRPAPAAQLRFCDRPLADWLTDRSLTLADVLRSADFPDHLHSDIDLYDLALFCVDADPVFLAGYLSVPNDAAAWAERFRAATRLTLRRLNDTIRVLARDERRASLRARSLRDSLAAGRGWRTASAADIRAAIDVGGKAVSHGA